MYKLWSASVENIPSRPPTIGTGSYVVNKISQKYLLMGTNY